MDYDIIVKGMCAQHYTKNILLTIPWNYDSESQHKFVSPIVYVLSGVVVYETTFYCRGCLILNC